MPWIHLLPAAPEITLLANGIIRWNAAAHALMGNPSQVNLLVNDELHQLALSPGHRWSFSEVWVANKLYYRLDASAQLEAAGLITPFSAEAFPVVEIVENGIRPTNLIAVAIP